MDFPFHFRVGPIALQAHFVLETLAYLAGFRVYLYLRRTTGDHIESSNRTWVIAAAIVGAAIGSKLLYWLSDPVATFHHWNDAGYLMGGKTIVGGLVGGLVAVEFVKRRLGIERRTGDLFAIPLCVGIAIGRVGCFLAGLTDDTFGLPTSLPWGIDFGDRIKRHPTQLYEIIWLVILAAWLYFISREATVHREAQKNAEFKEGRGYREGDLFKCFMVSYLGFRLIIDFIKPGIPLAGLTAIQWICLAGLLYYCRDYPYLLRLREAEAQ